MRARAYTELTTTELPDELRFRVVRRFGVLGWLYQAAWFAFLSIVFGFLLFSLFWVVGLGRIPYSDIGWISAAICTSTLLEYWLHGGVAELHITSDKLVATGIPWSSVFSRKETVATSEVRFLRWQTGELLLEPGGLWRRPIGVLPGLTLEQGDTVMDGIVGRFPGLWEKYPAPASLLSGCRMGLRPTSLSAFEEETPETES